MPSLTSYQRWPRISRNEKHQLQWQGEQGQGGASTQAANAAIVVSNGQKSNALEINSAGNTGGSILSISNTGALNINNGAFTINNSIPIQVFGVTTGGVVTTF